YTPAVRVISVTPTVAQVGVEISHFGLWSVIVRNPDYVASPSLVFSVAAFSAPVPVPTLNPTPVTVTTSLAEQSVPLTGTGFRDLYQGVVTRPPADASTLDVPNFAPPGPQYVSSTMLDLRGVFDRPGTWHVRIEQGSGTAISNTIDVIARDATTTPPTI